MKEFEQRRQENESEVQKMTPGETLRFIRRRRGLSLKKLGQVIGISESYASRIEKGDRNFPSKIVPKLVEELELNPEELEILSSSGAIGAIKEKFMSKERVRRTVALSQEEYSKAIKIAEERGITFNEVMRSSLRLRAKLEELSENISEDEPGVGKVLTVRPKEDLDKAIIF